MQVNSYSPKREIALDKLRSERYNEIMAHERAHQSAAGSYAGGITILYDKNNVAFSGFVPIHVPALDVYNPSKSIAAGNTIRGAALAPHNPSSADKNVAGIASNLIAKAQQLLSRLSQLGARVSHAKKHL